jgi:hypothetical protein
MPRRAEDLTRETTAHLMNWCDWHSESYWNDLTLGTILALYNASKEWESLDAYVEEDPKGPATVRRLTKGKLCSDAGDES